MQAGTTPIFNIFGMIWPSTNQELNPQNHLVSAESPHSVAFYDHQWLLRAYLSPGQGAPMIRRPYPNRVDEPLLAWLGTAFN